MSTVIPIHNFRLISQKLWKDLITQKCNPVEAIFFFKKNSKFEKAVILSQMILSFPKRQVHIYRMSV